MLLLLNCDLEDKYLYLILCMHAFILCLSFAVTFCYFGVAVCLYNAGILKVLHKIRCQLEI